MRASSSPSPLAIHASKDATLSLLDSRQAQPAAKLATGTSTTTDRICTHRQHLTTTACASKGGPINSSSLEDGVRIPHCTAAGASAASENDTHNEQQQDDEDDEEEEDAFFSVDMDLGAWDRPAPARSQWKQTRSDASVAEARASNELRSKSSGKARQASSVAGVGFASPSAEEERTDNDNSPGAGQHCTKAIPIGVPEAKETSTDKKKKRVAAQAAGAGSGSAGEAFSIGDSLSLSLSSSLFSLVQSLSSSLGASPSLQLCSTTSTSGGGSALSLARYLAPEPDSYGNLEYKWRILPTTTLRFDKLVTQMKWRLLEGGGCAIYEIGVLDDGRLVGIEKDEMKASLQVLATMARQLNAHVVVRRCVLLESVVPSAAPDEPQQQLPAAIKALDTLAARSELDLLDSDVAIAFDLLTELPSTTIGASRRGESAIMPTAAVVAQATSQSPAISAQTPTACSSCRRRASTPPVASAAANGPDTSCSSCSSLSSSGMLEADTGSGSRSRSWLSSSESASASSTASQPTTPPGGPVDAEMANNTKPEAIAKVVELDNDVQTLRLDEDDAGAGPEIDMGWELGGLDVEGIARHEFQPRPAWTRKRRGQARLHQRGGDSSRGRSSTGTDSPASFSTDHSSSSCSSGSPTPFGFESTSATSAEPGEDADLVKTIARKRQSAMDRRERRRREMKRKELEGMGIFDSSHPEFYRIDPELSSALALVPGPAPAPSGEADVLSVEEIQTAEDRNLVQGSILGQADDVEQGSDAAAWTPKAGQYRLIVEALVVRDLSHSETHIDFELPSAAAGEAS